jgi:alpha-amylase/alpha-mannosidase (GH57 family)
MPRYLCIHGHFYQPPRENPWLEEIEPQDGAHPYRDWNERIHAECYAPNAFARILDDRGRIVRITSNYSRISFDFGPTLLAWLERHARDTYGAVLDADRRSRELYGGHGSAIAQAYNHMILPLASKRDRRCQVSWGIRDFEHRFGRRPEGMWLPETAVDVETLEVLADLGIRFTILEPGQGGRTRARGGRWRTAGRGQLDPTTAYEVRLPSGAAMALFFYDGPVSRAIAFERLLDSGEELARRLLERFDDARRRPQLVHVATDGETYGHHHRFGEMALALALDRIASGSEATLTNYGRFLELHPPAHEVEIRENTSWSCAHGVERWRGDCGCRAGGHPAWTQAWRAPLRAALAELRDRLAPIYEKRARELLRDPWSARDDYVSVVLDRTDETKRSFLDRHALGQPSPGERVAIWKLLELERNTMLAYTSCGWFFDELSGIETVQVLRYAARAAGLAREVLGENVEPALVSALERAPSNDPRYGNGRGVWNELVRPAIVGLERAGLNWAIRRALDPDREPRVPGHEIERREIVVAERGRDTLALGRIDVRSAITEERAELGFAALRTGELDVAAWIGPAAVLPAATGPARQAFEAGGDAAAAGVLDTAFGGRAHGLGILFEAELREIAARVAAVPLAATTAAQLALHDRAAPLVRALRDLGRPVPQPLRAMGEQAVEARLTEALSAVPIDLARARVLVDEARLAGLALDPTALSEIAARALDRDLARLAAAPDDPDSLGAIKQTLELVLSPPFVVNLWRVENRYWALVLDAYPRFVARARAGDAGAAHWVDRFRALGQLLRVRVDP